MQVLALQARAGGHPQVQELRKQFNRLDTNGDGTVDIDELRAALVGSSMTEQQVQVSVPRQ
jgi:Ca2+-binding EF-hand superfamily protein